MIAFLGKRIDLQDTFSQAKIINNTKTIALNICF